MEWYQQRSNLSASDIQTNLPGVSEELLIPFVGEVPVTIEIDNEDQIPIMVGWQKTLAQDWSINIDIGLNGAKQSRLQLNKRF